MIKITKLAFYKFLIEIVYLNICDKNVRVLFSHFIENINLGRYYILSCIEGILISSNTSKLKNL